MEKELSRLESKLPGLCASSSGQWGPTGGRGGLGECRAREEQAQRSPTVVGQLHLTSLYHCASSKTNLSPNKNSNACIQLSRPCGPSPNCLEPHPGEGG